MALCSNSITYVAIVTNGTGVGGVAIFCTCRSSYIRCIIMSTGSNGELVSSDGTVGILKSGIILNLNLGAVLGEVKHCYHTLVFLTVLSIHSLRVYKYLSYDVAVVTGLRVDNYVIRIGMAADNHRDVGMLSEELIPKIVSGVIVGVVRSSVSGFASDAESSVTLHIVVSSNDYSMIRMCGNNLVCPNENVILSAVVERKKKVINGSCSEGVVNVVYSSLLVISGDIVGISRVVAEILVVKLNAVVAVTADKRIRNLAVHKGDSFLCGSPLGIGFSLIVIFMSNVYTELGDVTKSNNVLNIFGSLIIEDPLIHVLKKRGILIGDGLCIAYERKAIRILLIGKVNVLILPKHLLILYIVSVAGKIGYIGVSVCLGKLVTGKKVSIGSIKAACIVSRDLISTSYVGICTDLLDKALEIMVLTVLPILAISLCMAHYGISTDQELLVNNFTAICRYVLGESLLENTVDIAVNLAISNIVNYCKMHPGSQSDVYVSKSVVYSLTAFIGVREARITVLVYLEHNVSAATGTLVTEDGTTDFCSIVCRGEADPRLIGFDIRGIVLLYLVFTEVLNLNTAAVGKVKSVAVSGIVTQSSLTHSGNIVSGNKTFGGAAPGLCLFSILCYLRRGSYVAVKSNGVDITLKVLLVSASMVATYSEIIGEISRRRKVCKVIVLYRGYIGAVYVKRSGLCIRINSDSIMSDIILSVICAAEFYIGNVASLVVNVETDLSPLGKLYAHARSLILTVVT